MKTQEIKVLFKDFASIVDTINDTTLSLDGDAVFYFGKRNTVQKKMQHLRLLVGAMIAAESRIHATLERLKSCEQESREFLKIRPVAIQTMIGLCETLLQDIELCQTRVAQKYPHLAPK